MKPLTRDNFPARQSQGDRQLHPRVRRPFPVGFTRHATPRSHQASTTGCAGWRALRIVLPLATRAPERRGLRRGAGRLMSRLMPAPNPRATLRPAPGAEIVGPHPAGGRRAELLPITPTSPLRTQSRASRSSTRLFSPRDGRRLESEAPNGWRVSGERRGEARGASPLHPRVRRRLHRASSGTASKRADQRCTRRQRIARRRSKPTIATLRIDSASDCFSPDDARIATSASSIATAATPSAVSGEPASSASHGRSVARLPRYAPCRTTDGQPGDAPQTVGPCCD